jgi:hypothetical protein
LRVLHAPVTSAPRWRAIWTAQLPTPPEAPMTRTRCPGFTAPKSRMNMSAELPPKGMAAASSCDNDAGFRAIAPDAFTATSSACAPRPVAPNTASPTRKRVTERPTATTTPE